jgi:hypothetical protein
MLRGKCNWKYKTQSQYVQYKHKSLAQANGQSYARYAHGGM